ncbi:hypothetical protein NAT51_08150 [Flavobacterium amniphilum]|uniref:hypothetical protein n=1 Tax=Flavobacterium amniphilum TaxID=1834035 RepID=UPI002029CA9E|nr:hypothetical protein [Flavobacterium amniphilum]MCL9805490.1 hypothetical protein [Flavobacterium amniphilum]
MKKILFLLLLLPLMSMNIKDDKSKFVGKWVGEDKGEIGYFSFDGEGYASFEMQGQIVGGKEFAFEGHRGQMTYEVNQRPGTKLYWVDLIFTNLENGKKRKFLCLANFIDNNKMRFAINFEGSKRPAKFDTENSIVLKRQK